MNNMTPIDWAIRPLKNYANFSGRASRAEFWWFTLFVMIVYVVVMFVAVRLGRRNQKPVFANNFHEPEFKRIDTPLVVGAALFGIGWGMSGICPGPAISLIAFEPSHLWLYLVALLVGSYAGGVLMRRRGRAREAVPAPAE